MNTFSNEARDATFCRQHLTRIDAASPTTVCVIHDCHCHLPSMIIYNSFFYVCSLSLIYRARIFLCTVCLLRRTVFPFVFSVFREILPIIRRLFFLCVDVERDYIFVPATRESLGSEIEDGGAKRGTRVYAVCLRPTTISIYTYIYLVYYIRQELCVVLGLWV